MKMIYRAECQTKGDFFDLITTESYADARQAIADDIRHMTKWEQDHATWYLTGYTVPDDTDPEFLLDFLESNWNLNFESHYEVIGA